MAKNSIRDFDATSGNNTDIQSVDISEGCPASGINNAIRELMVDLKNVSTGAVNLETPGADQLNVDNIRIDGNTISSTDTNGDVIVDPNGTGGVGIGDNTPDSKLKVRSTSGTSTDIGIFEAAVGSYTGTSLVAKNSLGPASTYNLFECVTDSDGDAGGPFTEFLVRGDGRVGIGEASPAAPLHISTAASTTAEIRLTSNNTGSGSGDRGRIAVHSSRNDGTAYEAGRIDIDRSSGTEDKAHILFATNNGSGVAERMRIDNSGKIYFGRTGDPFMSTGSVKRLSIDGGTTSTDSTIVSNKNSASTMFHFYFHNSNSVVGSISTNAHATSFNTSSDHRLKENVSDMTGAINRVKSLQPKRFNWITEPDTTIDGFLAHEAATVVPESVTGSHNETRAGTGIVKAADGTVLAENVEQEDWTANKGDDEGDMYPSGSTWTASEDLPVYQTIDQAKLVPLLTGALQEAIAKIETLETEMTALKARVTALEA